MDFSSTQTAFDLVPIMTQAFGEIGRQFFALTAVAVPIGASIYGVGFGIRKAYNIFKVSSK